MWKGEKVTKIGKNIFLHGITNYKRKYSFSGNREITEPIKYSFFLAFELLKHDFDLIDVSAFPYFPVFPCKVYSLLKNKPIIVTWHEVWDRYWLDYWNNLKIIGHIGRLVEKLVSRLSKYNLCVSYNVAERLANIGTKKEFISVCENWIELDEINSAKPSKAKYDIISVGRHLKHKNFELLLRICCSLKNRFPGLRVLILGEGPETLNLLRIRKALDLEDCVDILSFTKTQGMMYSYLKSSKLFVLLSELEGFSLVSFEAMATGLPVITLNAERNALASYIENSVNGYKCKKTELEIAERISMLLYDDMLIKKIGDNAKKFASKFSAKKQISKIEKYYNQKK